MKFWRYLVIALHTAASMLASTNAMARQISKPEPLVILEQGSFAVGGKVVTAPGTFDPRKPRTPAGQPIMAITPMFSIRSQWMPESIRS